MVGAGFGCQTCLLFIFTVAYSLYDKVFSHLDKTRSFDFNGLEVVTFGHLGRHAMAPIIGPLKSSRVC